VLQSSQLHPSTCPYTRRGRILGWEETSQALDFCFSEGVHVSIFGREVWVKPTLDAKAKRYTFFYSDEDIAMARSTTGGGLSLLLRGQ